MGGIIQALERGGQLGPSMPYVGAFQDGGFVNQTGMGLLHAGEQVLPANGMKMGGLLSYAGGGVIELYQGQWVYHSADGQYHQLRVGYGSTGQQYLTSSGKWAPLAADTPVAGLPGSLKGGEAINSGGGAAAVDGGGDGGAGGDGGGDTTDTTPYSQADVDALNASIQALNDTIQRAAERQALVDQQLLDSRKSLNVSQSQYGILAQAIADVASGKIGGRVGLGFVSGSTFPGSAARY
jgi:hypothetical protein